MLAVFSGESADFKNRRIFEIFGISACKIAEIVVYSKKTADACIEVR